MDFLLDLCSHSEFISGNVHTNFIEHHHSELLVQKTPPDHIVIQVKLSENTLHFTYVFVHKINSQYV